MNRKLFMMRFKILMHSKYNFWVLMIIATVTTFVESLVAFHTDQSVAWIVFDVSWIIVNIAAFLVSVWQVLYYLLNRKELRDK